MDNTLMNELLDALAKEVARRMPAPDLDDLVDKRINKLINDGFLVDYEGLNNSIDDRFAYKIDDDFIDDKISDYVTNQSFRDTVRETVRELTFSVEVE